MFQEFKEFKISHRSPSPVGELIVENVNNILYDEEVPDSACARLGIDAEAEAVKSKGEELYVCPHFKSIRVSSGT